jgi:hypothetical protein
MSEQAKRHSASGEKHKHQDTVDNKNRPRIAFEAKSEQYCQHAKNGGKD